MKIYTKNGKTRRRIQKNKLRKKKKEGTKKKVTNQYLKLLTVPERFKGPINPVTYAKKYIDHMAKLHFPDQYEEIMKKCRKIKIWCWRNDDHVYEEGEVVLRKWPIHLAYCECCRCILWEGEIWGMV